MLYEIYDKFGTRFGVHECPSTEINDHKDSLAPQGAPYSVIPLSDPSVSEVLYHRVNNLNKWYFFLAGSGLTLVIDLTTRFFVGH